MNRLIACRAALVLAAIACVAPAAWAQQRPLLTEDPETVGSGNVLLETGLDYERDVVLPWSGLRGDVLSVLPFGVSIGVSSIAEIQFDAGFYQKMTIKKADASAVLSILVISGDTTSDVDDLNIGMKFKFLSETEGRPAMGFRFSTKLPNASNESGLGKDVQDFQTSIIVGKTIQSVRTVFNVGLQILGDPTTPAKQDDLLIFGLSVARAISQKAEVVGEYTGRLNFGDIITPGAEDRGALRFGARFTQGVVRLDAGILIGVTPRDPEFGFTAGLTWVFNAFKVPYVIAVAKAHAYGNDFLFVPADQAEGRALDELSRRLCARHTGIGGDGVIYYTTAPDGSARMKLINADGSPSELSGNGLRCLAALVLHQRRAAGLRPITEVRVDTDAGWKTLSLVSWQDGRYTFRAAMGQPERIAEETLDVDGEAVRVSTLAMGNPQCVSIVSELPDLARFHRLGPALATHPRFSAGTNVEFAVVEAPGRVRILIWERGVGPTMASGTGACASAIAASAHAGAARDIEVIAPGGTQRVEWREEGVFLTGWAEVVLDGQAFFAI